MKTLIFTLLLIFNTTFCFAGIDPKPKEEATITHLQITCTKETIAEAVITTASKETGKQEIYYYEFGSKRLGDVIFPLLPGISYTYIFNSDDKLINFKIVTEDCEFTLIVQ